MERTVAAAKVAVKVAEDKVESDGKIEVGGVVWRFGGFEEVGGMVGMFVPEVVPVAVVELEKRAEGERMVAIGGGSDRNGRLWFVLLFLCVICNGRFSLSKPLVRYIAILFSFGTRGLFFSP